MEAAEALGRGNLSTLYEATREAVRARSRAFWIVAGLSVLAAALRFATLGGQAYHHDEIVTASRLLRADFWHAMEAVGFSESAPPLYYALAWVWTQLTGTGELGLRSLSALAGVATVPVAYLLGAELRGRRVGIVAAALVAVNPMLLWYSQEARGYALLVLLTAVAALYFVRALEHGRQGDFTGWGIASALALATHYFAIFPIALEAAWLLGSVQRPPAHVWRRTRRGAASSVGQIALLFGLPASLPRLVRRSPAAHAESLNRPGRRGRAARAGLWIVALAGLALAPLAIHQMSLGHAEWIGGRSLGHRLWEVGVTFVVGETGDIIARPETVLPAVVPLLAVLAALTLLAARGDRTERRAGGWMLAIAATTIAVPLALALIAPGKDYVIARNLLPALVPLLVAVAIGVNLRGARRSGAAIATVLVAYSFGFCLWASFSPALQRPDWDAVAARLGEPTAPRAVVLWTLGAASLRYYLSTGSFQAQAADGYSWSVHEVDFVSDGPAPPVPQRLLGPRFRQTGYEQVGRLYVRRYTLPGPDLAHLRLRRIRSADLSFRSNGVLLDGIGPP